jgi:sugar lactone lactonase YvrE
MMKMMKMMKMQCARFGLCLVVLVVASCGFPRLSELSDDGGGGDVPTSDGEPSLSLELLAGDVGGYGNGDGTGAAARFSQPVGVAVDSVGNAYVADEYNHTIRKVTAAGIVTTLAGTANMAGSADGTGAVARFQNPTGVTVDSAGNVYVADKYNHTIRKVTAVGVVTTLAGTAGVTGSADGAGAAARFYYPGGVAVDSAGNIYVADTDNSTIRKVTAAGVVTTLAGTAGVTGSVDGTRTAARFSWPVGVAADSAGNVYVADGVNDNIRKVTAAGVVTTLAGSVGITGSTDGTGTAARFHSPSSVAVDSAGGVFVADEFNHTIRKVTAAGVVTTLAGTAGMTGSVDGTSTVAHFYFPDGVAVDSAGNVYVADGYNSTIRKVTAAGVVTTLAGAAGIVGSADGTGAAARFYIPSGVAVDSAGNVYVADKYNHIIRKVTAAGVATTLAGTAGMMGSADGTGTAARFDYPTGVAVDSAGNVYVTASSTIRKVTIAGVVTTLAGAAGMTGTADGTGTAARFYHPTGVAVDSAGNVYVADESNHTIRKVTAAGGVTTLAGIAGIGGGVDGTGSTARFYHPSGVAVDSVGNVYVADSDNTTIRKVTAAGRVTTLAGTPGMPSNAERSNNPSSVAVDIAGNVYIADQDNSTIRKVTSTGTITTVAGTAGVSGILLGATPRFEFPQSLTVIGDSIVVSDANAILLLRHGAQ